jgi:hypothetical protein
VLRPDLKVLKNQDVPEFRWRAADSGAVYERYPVNDRRERRGIDWGRPSQAHGVDIDA